MPAEPLCRYSELTVSLNEKRTSGCIVLEPYQVKSKGGVIQSVKSCAPPPDYAEKN